MVLPGPVGDGMTASNAHPRVKRDLSELSLLFEISQILDRSIDLRDELGPVLKAIAGHTGMLRGTITMVNRETGELFIEAAHGLSSDEALRGRYQPGEGIVGQVIQTGRPMVVPRVSEEPRFLNRTQARSEQSKGEISYICVPIKMENSVIGALSADRLFSDDVTLDEDFRLMSIIASMIA
jgi:Nif-specific regulatory protein